MLNNVAIDVCIGLIFIYLLYSLLATIVQEIVAQIFDLRARMLVKTIRVLLDDRKETSGNFFARWISHISNNIYHSFCPLCGSTLSKAFFQHPTIKYLAQSSWRSKPSYLSSYNFSSTLIRMFRGREYDATEPQMNAIYRTLFETKQVIVGEGQRNVNAALGAETLDHLKQLYNESQKDIDRFKALLEKWYDETMDRATGWYKKQTQIILLLIGLFLAYQFNVDTIAITTLLAKDKTARENLVQLAINSAPKYDTIIQKLRSSNPPDTTKKETKDSKTGKITSTITIKDSFFITLTNKEIDSATKMVQSDIAAASNIVGLGRPDKDSCKVCDSLKIELQCSATDSTKKADLNKQINRYNSKFSCKGNPYQKGGFVTLFGWLITALAISLGAPFWFDLLNKIIRLRAAGTKPTDSDTNTNTSVSKAITPGSSPDNRVG